MITSFRIIYLIDTLTLLIKTINSDYRVFLKQGLIFSSANENYDNSRYQA